MSGVWYAAFGLLVLVNSALLVGAMRQIGVLHQRLRPTGAGAADGPDVGTQLQSVPLEHVHGTPDEDPLSRRSFLGGVGKGSLAVVAGGSAVALVADPDVAGAAYGCTYDRSVDCYHYWGYNNARPAPAAAGREVCDKTRCSYVKRWSDCCGTGCSCHCVDQHPSCCQPKAYPQGCSGAGYVIKCRRW